MNLDLIICAITWQIENRQGTRRRRYAIVDEVDSVLIDVLEPHYFGPVPKGDNHEFEILKPKISSSTNSKTACHKNFIRVKKVDCL